MEDAKEKGRNERKKQIHLEHVGRISWVCVKRNTCTNFISDLKRFDHTCSTVWRDLE